MLTIEEVAVCLVVMFGVFFDAYWVSRNFTKERWYALFVSSYALFVMVPKLIVVLYALVKMMRD